MGKWENLSRDRIGETKVMRNGLVASVEIYRNKDDIDVRFENGVISKNRRYNEFVNGRIKCPMLISYSDGYAIAFNPNIATTFYMDTDDLHILGNLYWCKNSAGYIHNHNAGLLHRIIMNANQNDYVDHRNCDKLDNRKENLRICTHGENMMNRSAISKNINGYKGTFFEKRTNKWFSKICCDGKQMYLGTFDTPESAALAYNEAAIKYHGEFARLNKI